LSWFVSIAAASSGTDVVVEYSEGLQQLSFEYRGVSSFEQKSGQTLVSGMSFDAFGRRFDIDLEENRALMKAISNPALFNNARVYRGRLSDGSDSWVRMTITNGVPTGLIWDGQQIFAIDDAAGGVSIYNLDDLRVEQGAFSCTLADAGNNAGELFKTVVAEASANAIQLKAPGAISQIDIGVISDSIFAADKGANTETEMLTRMNNVDGIFSSQLGVQLNVTQVDIFSAGNDPFTSETTPTDLLNEVADYRFSNSAQNANGLSHLFTGRDLDNSTVGIAYGGGFGGAICSRRYGAGLTQATHSATFDSLIVAHELGHNFGSPHDGTSGSACESEQQTFLMAPSLNGSDTFSACSVVQMQDDIDAASCISPLPSADVSVSSASGDVSVLLGNTGTLVFDVDSNGTDVVANVIVDITIPGNVTYQSATSTAGTCSNGAGTVSCSLGSIAAGSGESITLSVGTPSVGVANVVANVTGSSDANSNNNQSSAQITIDPAIDIVVTGTSAVQVDTNASTTVNLTVANASSITATNVSVTVTPNSGIEFDTASWDSGTCDISNSIVTCDAASLVAQASGQLSLNLTGVSVGQQSYGVSVSTSETDRNMSNNNVSGQVTVGNTVVAAPPVNSADSGGGSMGISFLSLLTVGSLLSLRRRRFSRCDVSKGHN